MLRKKCCAFFLSAAMILGGITGVAADPQIPGDGQTESVELQNEQTEDDGMQPESGDEARDTGGRVKDKTDSGEENEEAGEGEEPETGEENEEAGEGEEPGTGEENEEAGEGEEPETGEENEEAGEGEEPGTGEENEEAGEGEEPETGEGEEPGTGEENEETVDGEEPGTGNENQENGETPESGNNTQTETSDEAAPVGEALKKTESSLAASAPRAKKSYYAGYRVTLDGKQDTAGDLAGLTFYLYEKAPGGDWNKVSEAQSQYSSYYRLSFVYFTYFQLEGEPVNEYKVVMAESASYSMQETVVQLDPNNLSMVYGSAIEGNYLSLTEKAVPGDNTDILVNLGSPTWSGSGTEGDPYTWSVTVDQFTGNITVRTVNSQAVILWNGDSYTGTMTEELPYDESVWDLCVKSSDGTKEIYYKISVTREKYSLLAPQNLTAVSPSSVGGSDGKIQGLDTSKLYEYRSEDEKNSGAEYHQVDAGASEITGLKAGKYYVRTQETETNEPSAAREVTVKEPVIYTVTLPEENIPAGVEVLECPDTMTSGRDFTLKFKLPKNSLLDKVSYTIKYSNGMTSSSSLPAKDYQYSQDGDSTIVTITHAAYSGNITLEISLRAGKYYQVQTVPGNGHTSDERGTLKLTGEESEQGGIRYFEEGTLTATVDLDPDWKGYAKISSLKAVRKGTGEEIPGTLTQTSDEQWTLTMNLAEDIEIHYDFQSYPADLTELNAIVEKIGSLEQYVADSALDTLKARLEFLNVYQQQVLKDQDIVNAYVALLEAGYNDLTLRRNLSEDGDVSISASEPEHVYDGKEWQPEITVSYQGSALTEGTDYRIIFPEDMTSPGEKEITVEFLGKYIGQRSITVSIVRYYTITATAGANGSISPEGEVMVREGGSQTFMILPDNGYHIQAVYVNEQEITLSEADEYTFENVSADAIINAVFEKDADPAGTSDPETTITQTPDKDTSDNGTSGTTATGTQTRAVDTADSSQPLLYIAVMLLSMAAAGAVILKRKKN